MFRSWAVVAALVLIVAFVGAALRPSTVSALASCNGPQVGYPIGPFYDCAECLYYGAEGSSQGQWQTWRCRPGNDGYYWLYVT